jgi:hypothetical protein
VVGRRGVMRAMAQGDPQFVAATRVLDRSSTIRRSAMNHVTRAPKLAITCLAMSAALVLGVPDAYAPQREKPEKISIDNVTWNSTTFEIDHRAQFGIARAGRNAEFSLRTVLHVSDTKGKPLDVLQGESDLVVRAGTDPDADRMVPVESQVVPWDRLDGTFSGPAMVTVLTELRNPAGATIGAATDTRMVEIR